MDEEFLNVFGGLSVVRVKLTLMEDNDIISSCLSGEKEAFEMLVKKYQAPLLHLAWRILGDKDEAKDATQDAFVQTFSNLDRFDRTKSFKNWLYSITYKRCIDRKRKEKSYRNFMYRTTVERPLYTRDSVHADRIEDSEVFFPALKKLSTKERVAIILKINDAYSASEIANVLGCAESTARVYLFNARKKLKKILKGKRHVLIF